jgi:hypothetical protein
LPIAYDRKTTLIGGVEMNAIKIDAGFKAVSQASLKIDILPSYTLHIMLSLLLDSQRPLKGIRGPMRSTTGRVGRWLQLGWLAALAGWAPIGLPHTLSHAGKKAVSKNGRIRKL